METAAKFRADLPTQSALENNSFKQLETDNAIYIEPKQEKATQKQSNVPGGIGENIINRMANLPTALEHKPVISTAEFKELQSIYQRVIKTPLRKRTAEDRAATSIYHKAKKGEIEVSDNSFSSPKQTKTKQASPKQTKEPAGKIADFGEVIEGAKKHTYSFNEAVSIDIDSSTTPLSKSFPKPDYEKLIASGIEPEKIAYIAMLRARIKTKPRKGYKLDRWQKQVDEARGITKSLLASSISLKDIKQNISELSLIHI